MSELETYIKSFFGVSRDELQTIASFFKPDNLKKGAFFVREGAYCNQLSFLRDGYLRTYLETEQKEVTQWISSPQYFVTELSSFMFRVPSRWNIQALSDCTMFTISEADYHQMGRHIPRWHQIEKLFMAKCFSMMEDRIMSFLSMPAKDRFQKLFDSQPELFNQVPLQYLASMIGMTPETFSRLRKKMLE
jgi:CRP-like cAMP-binding protein